MLLRRLGEDIRSGQNPTPNLHAVLAGFDALPPDIAIAGDREVANLAGLHGSWRHLPSGLVVSDDTDDRILARSPGLEWIYIFHANGRWREQALNMISAPPRNAFLFAALAYRLNDWAWQVRAAAERCARRVFPATLPDVVADAAMVLLNRKRYWRRWRDEVRPLDDTLLRQDVAGPLAERIIRKWSGPAVTVFNEAIRGTAIDAYLPGIAREAVQPGIRAGAIRCLINRHATWFEGYAQEWINKSLGRSRSVPVLAGRPLGISLPRGDLISAAAADRAAAVRKVAADSLIQYRNELPNLAAVAAELARDKNAGVRERMAFLERVKKSEG